MIPNKALRMSVLNAVLEIQEYRAQHSNVDGAEAARVLVQGPAGKSNYAYSTALELGQRVPELLLPNTNPRVTRLRTLIEILIVQGSPVWAPLIPKGRRYLAAYLEPNERQCFESAGLYHASLDDQAILWWDTLATRYRSEADAGRTATGRKGEQLTVALETTRLAASGRTDLHPEWVALEDNTLGYDVRSYDAVGPNPRQRYIEVKATELLPPRFFLSRSEWEVAAQLGERYLFHVWHLPTETLHELPVSLVSAHIPIDQRDGTWHRVLITVRDAYNEGT